MQVQTTVVLFLFWLFSTTGSLASQPPKDSLTTQLRKNVFHGSAGILVISGSYNFNYERMLVDNKCLFFKTIWLRANYGGWGVWSSGGPYQSVLLNLMTGQHKGHLEVNAGVARMSDKYSYDDAIANSQFFQEPLPTSSDFVDFVLAGSLGYRFQAPKGFFVFRAGIGYPDFIYLSFGVAF